jgi:holo-[acyl-carrier protein] synthase
MRMLAKNQFVKEMILGVGTDITRIRRIEMALVRGGKAFKNRAFTASEQAHASKSRTPAATYARRWAAKEACLKAMGIGQMMGVAWTDIEVGNNDDGKPFITLHGSAVARLAEITPAGMKAFVHVSMSDEDPFSQAFVIINAVKQD